MMYQTSLFPLKPRDINDRKSQIYKWFKQKKRSKEKLRYIYQTLEMMMDRGVEDCVTTEIDWSFCEYIRLGYEVEQKYIDYVINNCHCSLTKKYATKRRN